MHAGSHARRLLALAAAAGGLVAASTLLGITPLTWHDITSTPRNAVFWDTRVPRAALAAAAGAGLAVGGVLFQALFRNPLATPYTLGIDSGASFGAAVGFLTGVSGMWSVDLPAGLSLGVPRLALLALAGALGALALVFLMARTRGGQDMTRLLLAGVCIAYLSSAGALLVTFIANRAVTNDIIVWTMGSLAVLRPQAARDILVVLLPLLAYAVYQHRAFDLLAMGDQLAAARGVNVQRTVWITFLLVGVLTAVIVANCGPIGFVGLMVPHMARALLGPRTLPLVLGSALIGAAFLALCDGLARSLSVYEPPVGVLTNIVGAMFFFYLLATRAETGLRA